MPSLKIRCGDEIRRIKVDDGASFADIVNALRNLLCVPDHEDIIIRYLDDEGDRITLSSDVELREALSCCKEPIQLYVTKCPKDSNLSQSTLDNVDLALSHVSLPPRRSIATNSSQIDKDRIELEKLAERRRIEENEERQRVLEDQQRRALEERERRRLEEEKSQMEALRVLKEKIEAEKKIEEQRQAAERQRILAVIEQSKRRKEEERIRLEEEQNMKRRQEEEEAKLKEAEKKRIYEEIARISQEKKRQEDEMRKRQEEEENRKREEEIKRAEEEKRKSEEEAKVKEEEERRIEEEKKAEEQRKAEEEAAAKLKEKEQKDLEDFKRKILQQKLDNEKKRLEEEAKKTQQQNEVERMKEALLKLEQDQKERVRKQLELEEAKKLEEKRRAEEIQKFSDLKKAQEEKQLKEMRDQLNQNEEQLLKTSTPFPLEFIDNSKLDHYRSRSSDYVQLDSSESALKMYNVRRYQRMDTPNGKGIVIGVDRLHKYLWFQLDKDNDGLSFWDDVRDYDSMACKGIVAIDEPVTWKMIPLPKSSLELLDGIPHAEEKDVVKQAIQVSLLHAI